MPDNKRKLYDVLSKDYDLGSFEQFSNDLNDEEKRKKAYEAVSASYDVGDFEKFSSDLGLAAVGQKADAGVIQQPETPEQPAQEQKPIEAPAAAVAAPAVKTEPEETPVQQRERLEAEMRSFDDTVGPLAPGQREERDALQQQYRANPLVQIDERIAAAQAESEEMENRMRELISQAYANPALLSSGVPMDIVMKENPEYARLQAASENRRQEIRQLEHLRDGNANNFFVNMGDVFADPNTWTFGFAGLENNLATLVAAKKDRDNEATQVLLGSLLDRQVAEVETEEQRGFWGRAGRIAGQMVPFMVEMGIGGEAVDALGKAAGINVGKYVEKQAVKALGTRVGKVAGTLAGDLAFGVGMAGTIGAGHTASGMIERKEGSIRRNAYGNLEMLDGHYEEDPEGSFRGEDGKRYTFVENPSWIGAGYKALMSQALEYSTEKLGDHIQKGIAASIAKRAAKKGKKALSPAVEEIVRSWSVNPEDFGLTAVSRDIRRGAGSKVAENAVKYLDKMGIQSYPFEGIEEEANIIFNAALVGDNKFSDLWDGETQADIWGGMFFSAGLMQGIPLTYTAMSSGVYSAAKAKTFHSLKHNLGEAQDAASVVLGDRWEGLHEHIDATENEGLPYLEDGILNSDEFSKEEKEAICNYIHQLETYRGFNQATAAQAREAIEAPEEEEPISMSPFQEAPEKMSVAIGSQLDNAYMGGYNAADENQADLQKAYEYQQQALNEKTGLEHVSPDDAMLYFESGDWDDAQKNAMLDYMMADEARQGMFQHVRDGILRKVAAVNRTIDRNTSKTDGMVHPVVMKDGRSAYVVDGTVVLTDDGTMVDVEKSSHDMLMRDADTGRLFFAASTQVSSADLAIDPADEKQTVAEQLIESIAQESADRIDGILSFAAGDQYTLTTADGNSFPVQVVANEHGIIDNGDGTVNVIVNGAVDDAGNPVVSPMPKEQIQAMADATRMAVLNQYVQELDGARAARERIFSAEPAAAPAQQEGGAQEAAPAEEEAAEVSTAIPVDANGRKQYMQAPMEVAYEDIYSDEDFENDDEAYAFITGKLKRSKAVFDEQQKSVDKIKPEDYDSPKEYREAKNKAIEAARPSREAYEYWKGVQELADADIAAAKEREERAARNEEQALREPMNIEEVVANAFRGMERKLDKEDFKRETGLPEEELRRFFPFWAKKGQGISLTGLAERIAADDDSGFIPNVGDADKADIQAVRNAILEVFGGAARPTDIYDYTRNANLLRQAENEKALAEAEERARLEAEAAEAVTEEAPEAATAENPVIESIQQAAEEVNTEPTEAQKEAGNYKKGHVKIDGYDISIENPKGSVRRGTDRSGKEWEQEMNNNYGYIRRTEGPDGDHIDVFLSDNPTEGNVFVVDQVNPENGQFDEHKVMYGFPDAETARAAYLSNYEEGWQGLGGITEVTKDEFKKWVESSHRKTKPFAEYKSVKPVEQPAPETEGTEATQTAPAEAVQGALNFEAEPETAEQSSETMPTEEAQVAAESVEEIEQPAQEAELPSEGALAERASILAGKITEIERQISEGWDEWLHSDYRGDEKKSRENIDKRMGMRMQQRELENELKRLVASASAEDFAALEQSDDKGIKEVVADIKKGIDASNKRSRISALVAKEQRLPDVKAKPLGKFKAGDYLAPKNDARVMMTGTLHDKGYAVSSDAHIIVADKETYDKKYEGKVIGRDGNELKGSYPRWREILNFDTASHEKFDFGKLRDFIASVTEKVGDEYENDKASGNVRKETKKDRIDHAKVILNLDTNVTVGFFLGRLARFADYADRIGAKEIYFTDSKHMVSVKTSKGIAGLMPMQIDYNGHMEPEEERAKWLADGNTFSFGNNEYQKEYAKTSTQEEALTLVTGKTAEQRREEREAERQKPIMARIKDWEGKIGARFVIVSSESDVADEAVKEAIRNGEAPSGWFDADANTAYIFPKMVKNEADLDKTILHEVVSHKGLRELLGEEGFNELMDAVWNDIMTETDRKRWLDYNSHLEGDQEFLQRAAADEYVAHIAENIEENPTAWERFVEKVKEILHKIGIDLKVTDADLRTLLQASLANYERQRAEAKAQERAGLERKIEIEQARQEDVAAKEIGARSKADNTAAVEKSPQVPISQAQEKYEDFGNKIGWARKDLAESGKSRKKGDGDARPAWLKKYNAANIQPLNEEDKAMARRMGLRTDFTEVPQDVLAKGPDYSKPFVGYYTETGKSRIYGKTTRKHYITDENRQPIVFTSQEQYEATIPVFEAKEQGYRIAQDGEKFKIVRSASNGKRVEYAVFDTREEAAAYLASPEGCTDLLNRKRENYELPALTELTRNNMPDYRMGRNITPADFQREFGFWGGEFGNWDNADERQQFLNYAYDALMDLANVLGVSPGALSLNGELSIAFGSRGHGGKGSGAAHYEPTKAVINLTKMNGAGSLAHEWAHALDNYFGLMDAKQTRNREEDVPENQLFLSEGTSWKKGVREEVRMAFKDVMDAIKRKTVTRAIAQDTADSEVEDRRKRLEYVKKQTREELERGLTKRVYNRKTKEYDKIKYELTPEQFEEYDRLVEQLESDPTFKWEFDIMKMGYRASGDVASKLYDLVKEVQPNRAKEQYGPLHNVFWNVSRLQPLLQRAQEAREGKEETVIVDTDVYKDSKWFDRQRAGDYYSKDVELFARAFENYVSGEMRGEGQSSDYLTYEKGPLYQKIWEHNPYPAGEERASVKMAFDKLFDAIQEQADPQTGKPVLFRKDSWETEGGNVFFRKGRSLVGLHNISESKLRKALKTGGLANPSAAVIDIDRQKHEDFGEISLVMPSSLVDSETGRNAGTFNGDAWTPTYPGSQKIMTDAGWDKFWADLRALPEEVRSQIRNAWDGYLEDDRLNNALYWWFLNDTGRKPAVVKHESALSQETKEFVRRVGEMSIDDLRADEESAKRATALFRDSLDEETAEKLQAKQEPLEGASERVKRNIAARNADIDKYGLPLSWTVGYIRELCGEVKREGRMNEYATFDGAANAVTEQNLAGEFNGWLDEKADSYGAETKLFAGWTEDGDRIWVENTVENASRLMNSEPEQNAYGNNGMSATTAGLRRKMQTLAEIRKHKDMLVSAEEYEQRYQEVSDELAAVIGYLADRKIISDNQFTNFDIAESRLQEALPMRSPVSYLNTEYGYTIPVNGEYAKQLDELKKHLKAMPARYFETKFRRPVMLEEFAAAVVPSDLSEDMRKALADANVATFEYDPKVEDSRREATMQATEGEGIRFRKAYHGSGKEFERFDHAHMGEGEGAQAHGWGTYVSFTEDTAKGYATRSGRSEGYDERMAIRQSIKELSDQKDAQWKKNSERIYAISEKAANLPKEEKGDFMKLIEYYAYDEPNFVALQRAIHQRELLVNSMENAVYYKRADIHTPLEEMEIISDAVFMINNLGKATRENFLDYYRFEYENYWKGTDREKIYDFVASTSDEDWTSNRNLYEVEIPEDNGENYIHEEADAKLTDVVEVWDALSRIAENDVAVYLNLPAFHDFNHNHTGKSNEYLYDDVARILGSKKEASKLFESIGYVGILYDGHIDGPCAVIFDEGNAQITSHIRFRKVEDKAKIEELENGEKETGYRNVVLNPDGTLGSPMAGRLGKKGEKSKETSGFSLNEWEQAEENPNMATEDGKINLIKPNGRGSVDGVDYNPYIHIRPNTLNKQFTQAWRRPELVYVETQYPTSELESGYKAEKAKLSVGKHPWNGGELILSRYDKPVRIVPWEEVADEWVKEFGQSGVTFDIVPPSLLPILSDRGVEILPPKKAAGQFAMGAYEDWNKKKIADQDVKNVVISEEDHPFETRSEVKEFLGDKGRVFHNESEDVDIRVSLGGLEHRPPRRNGPVYRTVKKMDEIIGTAKKIGELPVDQDELDDTKSVSIYYAPVNVLGSQYSARMVVKEYIRFGRVLEDLGLYNYSIHKEKAQPSSDSTSEEGGAVYGGAQSFYKVRDLIHKTQEEDQKLLGIPQSANLRFRKSNENQEIFISNAEASLDHIKMDRATPEQWLKMLAKDGGLKAGEDKWLGLSDWLKERDKKTISKQEVLDFIEQNKIRIEEQDYSEDVDVFQMMRDEIREKVGRGRSLEEIQGEIDELVASDEYKELFDDEARDKWLLEQMCDRYGDDFAMGYWIDEMQKVDYSISPYDFDDDTFNENIEGTRKINSTRASYTTNGLEHKREIALTIPSIEPWNAGDKVHFGDAGEGRAIAWIRFGDTYTWNELGQLRAEVGEALMALEEAGPGSGLEERADAAKKALADYEAANPDKRSATNRVLVIDEIQSKRHQTARERGGYKDEGKIAQAKERVQQMMRYYGVNNLMQLEEAITSQQHYDDLNEYKKLLKDVPAAPFERNWHELAMKRMLRYAAENGYDSVAWTTGDQQAERYRNVMGTITGIEGWKEENGDRRFLINVDRREIKVKTNEEGKILWSSSFDGLEGSPLSSLVGKEMAVKMMTLENGGRLDGEDIVFKGEGMRGFYDDILPRFMNKYGRKWGASVKDIELQHVFDEVGRPLVMHSVDVTPEMKESVMSGQVMFRKETGNFEEEDPRDVAARLVDQYDNQDGEENPWMSERELLDRFQEEMPYGRETEDLFAMIDKYNRLDDADFEEGRRDFSGSEKDEVFNGFVDALRALTKVGNGIRFRLSRPIDEIVEDGRQKITNETNEARAQLLTRMRSIDKKLAALRQAAAAQREYDRKTVRSVTDLAKELMQDGAISDVTRQEIEKMLTITRWATGRKDLQGAVDAIMDLMVGNQLRHAKGVLDSLLKIRGSKVDAKGVEVQGKLDAPGQRMMQVFKDAMDMSLDAIDDLIASSEERLDSEDDTIKAAAGDELAGLQMARQYVENIKASIDEEKGIKNELRQAAEDRRAGKMAAGRYRDFVSSSEDAIRENRIERIDAYNSLTDDLGKMVIDSIVRGTAFREKESERIEKIHHFANSDLEGRKDDEHGNKDDRFANNVVARFLLKPLATFDQMLRYFGEKSVNGEGYLWNYFMRLWADANDAEYLGMKAATDILDSKVSEVFGRKMLWSDLYAVERKMPTVTVKFWDGGKMKDHELTQGNLLYIYMANKMSDGRMKLRRMGIDEEDVQAIVRQMDPRFIELADWLQGDFLVHTRNKYNKVYEEMFGAPMPAIDNYFPLKILANARVREVDMSTPEMDGVTPATITGSIIKRRRNSLALDVLGSDAFSVVIEHIQQMEHWAAFAKFNRDLNTLLSYKKFRNRVQNMSGIYGAGSAVFENFRKSAEIVAGVYRPAVTKDSIDTTAVNIAKGVTAAKISFRVYTAIKQLLSMPAFISDANVVQLGKSMATPWKSWNWAMEELPAFQKRWKSKQAGDTRLMKTDSDWKLWRNNFVKAAGRIGMAPNAFVDALTIAIGAKAMYDTRYKQYVTDGYSEEQADKRAKQDATILFNETQQSNEGAFVSAMQLDRTWASVGLTVFRNSSMGYERQLVDAVRNLARRGQEGYKEQAIDFMTKQMVRDGLDEVDAKAAAERRFQRAFFRDAMRVALFGFVMQVAWNLGAYLPYLVAGGGDDDKDKMLKDALLHAIVGGTVEGLTGGSIISEAANMIASGEGIENYNPSLMPVASDIQKIIKLASYDQVAAVTEIFNLLVQSGIGVNPQTLTDIGVAIYDACHGDMETAREATLLLMRIMQVPQSQTDKILMDGVDFTADKGLDMTIEEFAGRYANYKLQKNTDGVFGWLYSDEAREKRINSYSKRFIKDADEHKKTRGSDEQREFLEFLDEYKATGKTLRELKSGLNTARQQGDVLAVEEYAGMIEDLTHTPEYQRYASLHGAMNAWEKVSKQLKNVDSTNRDSVEDAMLAIRRGIVEELRRQKEQDNDNQKQE